MPEAHCPHDVAEVVPGEELLLLRVKQVKAHLTKHIVRMTIARGTQYS